MDNPKKIAILSLLVSNGPTHIYDISKQTNIKKPTVYKYLCKMETAGIINHKKMSGKKGKLIYHIRDFELSINKNKIYELTHGLEKLAAIIFDIDDTLIRRTDIPEQIIITAKEAIERAKNLLEHKGLGITYPPDDIFSAEWIQRKYGNHLTWYFESVLAIAGVSDKNLRNELTTEAVRKYYERIENTAENCRAFDDVLTTLETLSKKGVVFFAMSNSSHKAITNMLKNNKIEKYFWKEGKQMIIGGDEFPKSAKAVNKALEMLKIEKNNCFLIGDTGKDINVGREADLDKDKTIAIHRGIVPIETLKAIKPDVKIIQSLKELEKII